MPRILLSRHVYVCRVSDACVVLDTRTSRYGAIEGADARTLGLWVTGWPVGAGAAQKDEARTEAVPVVVRRCFEKWWLTEEPAFGKAADPVVVAAPTDVIYDELGERPRWNVRFLVRLAYAIVKSGRFRRQSIEDMVLTLRRRAAKVFGEQPLAAGAQESVPFLVRTYRYYRPLFYGSHDECLYDSLVLAHLMLFYRQHFTLVIGVQYQPFCAHSWIQTVLQGRIHVLNDDADFVGSFTPILAVEL